VRVLHVRTAAHHATDGAVGHFLPRTSLELVVGVIALFSGNASTALGLGRTSHSPISSDAGMLWNAFSPMGLAFLSSTCVAMRVMGVRFALSPLSVCQTRKPIGKFPFNPSKALLWTTKPFRYLAFQCSRKASKFGALTYFSVLNIATVAVGSSRAMRVRN
jgi:hypothetical protein